MLVKHHLFGVENKIKNAIELLQAFEPPEGYYLAFSGGKDSVAIKALADMAGVKYDAHYNHTTVDPPELVYFIRRHHPNVIVDKPAETMWQLIVRKKYPPTRIQRYCCRVLKEGGGTGRFCITGVRWAESVMRKNKRAKIEINSMTKNQVMLNNDNDEARRVIENCVMKSKHIINPIIGWTDDDVWEFIHRHKIQYCKLYDEGFKRLGCIGCPMASVPGRLHEFKRWPKYYQAYLRAFDRMLQAIRESGKETTWKTAQDVMDWWIYEPPKEDPNQEKLF
jgi:phosphoadenosine phosphosulfate reductase